MNVQIKKSAGKPAPGNIRGFDWASALYWTLTGIAALGVGYGIATQTFFIVTAFIAALTVLVVRKKMLVGLGAVLFLPVIGELYRLPFGPDNGTLISDVAIAAIVAVWLVEKIRKRQKFPETEFNRPLELFSLIAVFSLLVSLAFLQPGEVAAGSLYLVRLLEYVMLGIITMDTAKNTKDAMVIIKTMVISAMLIAVAGFIQLIIYPDLGNLVEYGWDPHMNRLVSTWLDPNFIAGFISYILAIVVGITLYTKSLAKKSGLIVIVAVLAVALFLTYSRSGYLAAAAALGIIGILKSRKLLIGSVIIFIVALNFLPRAQERVDDLYHSVESFVFNTSTNPDPTARLRIQSWNQTLELIWQRPLLGSGYNTLKYVKYDEGFIQNTDVHSASGSDSSLLTILATTGVLGLFPFLWLYWNALKLSFQNWRSKKIPLMWQGYGLGVFAGTMGLLVHSLFVNSLLFAQIMIFFWISVGILVQKRFRRKPTA